MVYFICSARGGEVVGVDYLAFTNKKAESELFLHHEYLKAIPIQISQMDLKL